MESLYLRMTEKRLRGIKYQDKADINFGLSVYVFTPADGGVTGNRMRRVMYRLGVKPEIHREKWYEKFVEKNLGAYIKINPKSPNPDEEHKSTVKHIADVLVECANDGTISSIGDRLYFRNSDKYIWTTTHIGWFMMMLKRKYDLGQGVNEVLTKIFNEPGMTKYSSSEAKIKDDKLFVRLKGVFNLK